MNFNLSVLAAMLLTLAVTLSGCRSGTTSEDGRTFERVASRLDADGSYFMVANPRYLLERLERDGSRLVAMMAQSDLPREIRDPFLLFSSAFEIGWHLSGVDELTGYGRSSSVYRRDENGRPRLFTNRSTVLLKPGAEGALWALWGRKNRPLSGEFDALPVGTAFAADFEFHPEAIWEALCKTDRSAGELDRISRKLLNIPLEKLLRSISGEIGVLLFLDDGADPETLQGVHALVVLNDRERFLFRQLGRLAQLLPGTKMEENAFSIDLTEDYPGLIIRVSLEDSMLFATFGADTMEKLGGAARLAGTPEFRELAEGLPAEGSGFFYVGSPLSEFLALLLSRQFDDRIVFDASRPVAGLAVTRCEPDGWSTIARATVDYNQIEFLQELALPFFAVVSSLSDQFAARQNTILEGRYREECRSRLVAVRDALMKYADSHKGAFPAQAGIGGLKELLENGLRPAALICPGSEDEAAAAPGEFTFDNCSYLYFEGYTRRSNPKLPLLIDWPFNHTGAVNVILVDGTIETLKIADAENCRKVASFLQTRYQYSEKEFRELFRKASRLDQQFELE